MHRKRPMPPSHGLPPLEAHVLMAVCIAVDHGVEARPSDIARRFRITPSAVSQTLKALEARGLVRRERSASDSRTVRVVLTEEGRALSAKARRERDAFVDGMIAAVGEGDMRGFVAAMRKIAAYCDAYAAADSDAFAGRRPADFDDSPAGRKAADPYADAFAGRATAGPDDSPADYKVAAPAADSSAGRKSADPDSSMRQRGAVACPHSNEGGRPCA